MPLEGSGHTLRLHGSDTSRQCPHQQNFGAMRKPVGPYREAAMALTFGTDVVSYDVEAPQRPPSSGSYGILAPSGERETMPMPQDGAKG